jgi:Fe-S cluster biogenesis protein NfuA
MIMSGPAEADGVTQRVARFLATELAPALQMNGDALEVVEVKDRVARLRLRGACCCDPASIMGVVMGLEGELRRQVPEVVYVEIVP